MKKIRYSLIAVAVIMGISGCSTPSISYRTGGVESQSFAKFVEEYNAMPGKKAMAVADNNKGDLVYGYAHSRQTIEQARNVAMEQCEITKKDAGLDADCEIYKEDD